MKILHTADNHLRDRHLSRSDRGEDFTRALNQVVDVAVEHKVAAILDAGDLLDSNRPSPKTIHDLARLHYRLQDEGIWMFVVNGDHDQSNPHWAELLQFHVGQGGGIEDNPGIYVLNGQKITIPKTDLTVYGMPFIGKTKEKYLEIKDTLPAADILLWHAQVKEFAAFFGHDAITMDELPNDRYSFIALGDIHVQDYKQTANGVWVGYPGTTELITKAEPLQKTVSIVEFGEDHRVKGIELVPLRTRLVKVLALHTEEEVAAAVQMLEKVKDQHPIVYGDFDRRIPGVLARVHAVLDMDKSIVRLQAYPENKAPDQVQESDDAEIIDFLPEYHATGTDSYDLAASLLQPDVAINDRIDTFINQRLAA